VHAEPTLETAIPATDGTVIGIEELYARYARDVFRFALYLCGDATRAEDIASETFVRAWASPQPIRQATVKAYLLVIARNLYLEQMRRESRRDELPPELPDRSAGPERSAEQRERLRRVLSALQGLPELDRSALLMRALDEVPYEQIAASLGLSLAAVKVKVHRARLKLALVAEGGNLS
jgi:RNA polymerase sigma-70 factor (ECF subfamily)